MDPAAISLQRSVRTNDKANTNESFSFYNAAISRQNDSAMTTYPILRGWVAGRGFSDMEPLLFISYPHFPFWYDFVVQVVVELWCTGRVNLISLATGRQAAAFNNVSTHLFVMSMVLEWDMSKGYVCGLLQANHQRISKTCVAPWRNIPDRRRIHLEHPVCDSWTRVVAQIGWWSVSLFDPCANESTSEKEQRADSYFNQSVGAGFRNIKQSLSVSL